MGKWISLELYRDDAWAMETIVYTYRILSSSVFIVQNGNSNEENDYYDPYAEQKREEKKKKAKMR